MESQKTVVCLHMVSTMKFEPPKNLTILNFVVSSEFVTYDFPLFSY